MVGAKHANTRAELGSAKRDHVLADMGGYNFAILRCGVRQDVLDEVIPVLIAGNIDEWDPWTVHATFADAVEVAAEELGAANFQALLNHLGSELIHAVLSGIADNVVNGPAAVGGGAMLANVLDTPVAKLAVSDDVDVC